MEMATESNNKTHTDLSLGLERCKGETMTEKRSERAGCRERAEHSRKGNQQASAHPARQPRPRHGRLDARPTRRAGRKTILLL